MNKIYYDCKSNNEKIVINSDLIVAFLHDDSPGTKMTIDIANKHNVPVIIITS